MTIPKSQKNLIEFINKSYNASGCMKCAIWDAVAKDLGKRGMCEECFTKNYVHVECIFNRQGSE
jgi:hypothetical protein